MPLLEKYWLCRVPDVTATNLRGKYRGSDLET